MDSLCTFILSGRSGGGGEQNKYQKTILQEEARVKKTKTGSKVDQKQLIKSSPLAVVFHASCLLLFLFEGSHVIVLRPTGLRGQTSLQSITKLSN